MAVFAVDFMSRGAILFPWLCLSTAHVVEHFQIWRVATYMFIHSHQSILHILFNMLMLWMFGVPVVSAMGERKFLSLYLSAGAFAGLCTVLFDLATGNRYPTVGASGAVFAIAVAFARFYPTSQILLFFLFPVQARWAVAIFIGIDLLLITDGGSNIAHAAHLGGALYALGYFRYEHLFESAVLSWNKRREAAHRRERQRKSEAKRRESEEVDAILAKISREGMHSLSAGEKKLLHRASEARKNKVRDD